MGVTHIIRGDDHLNNGARQTQIYQALGWKVPIMSDRNFLLLPSRLLDLAHGIFDVLPLFSFRPGAIAFVPGPSRILLMPDSK